MAKKVQESFLESIEIKKPPQNDAEALMIYENWLVGSVLVCGLFLFAEAFGGGDCTHAKCNGSHRARQWSARRRQVSFHSRAIETKCKRIIAHANTRTIQKRE